MCATSSSALAHPTSLIDHANAFYNNKQFGDAIITYKQTLNAQPEIIDALNHLANAYAKQEEYENAVHIYATMIDLNPGLLYAYIPLSTCLAQLNQFEKAAAYCQQAVRLKPDYTAAYFHLSRAYYELHRYQEGIAAAQKVVELEPNNIPAILQLGHVYNKSGNTQTAIVQYKKALELDPNFANARYNLGYTLRLEGKLNEALVHLNKAIELKPDYLDAHICRAQCWWSLDQFDNAFDEYEWRWKMFEFHPNDLDIPVWDSTQDLQNKTILIYAEQGMGDTLQFVRYAKEFKKRGAIVWCKAQKPLHDLLRMCDFIDHVEHTYIKSAIDFQAPIMSLPRIFKTQPDTIPAYDAYLKADEKLVALWQKKLGTKKLKVGLCWHVDPQHEITKSPYAKRSIHLKEFASLAHIPGIRFYSLQKVTGEDQLKEVPDYFKVHTFGPDFDESHGRFMDTAAVIKNLDLIITVDTSIAHLAAGLGKPVWMLLPFAPDCRWYLDRDDSPWYPTMKLFRQPKPFDWQTPIAHVCKQLTKRVS